MALQLAAGRAPSLTADELQAMKARLAGLEGGYASSLLDYPALVAADGRQDFLHFFLYPLVVAPAVVVADAIGAHPHWAFTVVNAMLLAVALFVAARHAPLAACVAGFVSPIVWWVDKAHTEAFLFAAVAVAALSFRSQPALAMIAFAFAGAQNAALGVTYPIFVVLSAAAKWRGGINTTWYAAAVGGALLVVSPFVYTWSRLGRWSLMVDYAQRAVPSAGGLAAFIVEPNIGILPNAPVYLVGLVVAVWLAVARGDQRRSVDWWWPVIVQAVLIVVWSQNPNANHGGTPGMNRWVLSLLALSLPFIADAHRRLSSAGRTLLNAVVMVTSVASVPAYLPSQPENYRTPTRLASAMWGRGWVHVTPAEVFAERASGREPAFAPTHDGACRVLLIANQQSPVTCAPPAESLPGSCRGGGSFCYAVTDGEEARFVLAPANGFFYNVAEPSWPAGGPLAIGVRRALREADAEARVWRVEDSRAWAARLSGADVGVVLGSDRATVIYLQRVSADALRTVAAEDETHVMALIPYAPAEYSSPMLTNVVVIVAKTGR